MSSNRSLLIQMKNQIYSILTSFNFCDNFVEQFGWTYCERHNGLQCNQCWCMYGWMYWGCSCHFSKAFVLQKRTVRIMIREQPRFSCKPLFIKLNIMTLPSLYIYVSVLFIKKQYPENPDVQEKHYLMNW